MITINLYVQKVEFTVPISCVTHLKICQALAGCQPNPGFPSQGAFFLFPLLHSAYLWYSYNHTLFSRALGDSCVSFLASCSQQTIIFHCHLARCNAQMARAAGRAMCQEQPFQLALVSKPSDHIIISWNHTAHHCHWDKRTSHRSKWATQGRWLLNSTKMHSVPLWIRV